jgi:antitoxin component of RelBE/YafQ-DinJ toxin-antitoxin module
MPMDTELIRFRIDPEIRDKAEEVCSALGHELNDVLRAAVLRIARDGALPFDLGAGPAAPAPDAVPFYHYDERLWASMKTQIDAEVALALLSRFIADCSMRLDEAADVSQPDAERLTRQRDEARQRRRELDVTDATAVKAVLDTYGPLVRHGAG